MTSPARFYPTRDLRRLQRDLDALFGGFAPGRRGNTDARPAAWTPRVDLAETPDAYRIYMDLPGLSKEAVEIHYQDGTLTVSGERVFAERNREGVTHTHIERVGGPFFRAFTLPQAIDAARIKATYEDGVLTIHVPKAEVNQPRRISIK
ncbi:hypothetical protein AWN76_005050 [Rhodothermaceae bacterium RA]|nr:hypothetical protein AWN76_005050 [Rhodothermaceae bacterium RA]